ncbi:zinc-ribbon domain-containing protein [Clostridium estertheticum]|uniref:zinc-ribbon domain-containing protein n=1 Tax=Clostridium estertheticum TaxID=238834 RepID=UPI001C0E5896|nr:zinc-ribbon domain-containing protein [Clostridium estertheticum]MBU3186656.1 hypothetical protein [Clostridium estertheticum]
MSLLSEVTVTNWNSANKKWFENKGYTYTKMKDEFIVKVEDLNIGSHSSVNIVCDGCNKKSTTNWRTYKRSVREDGKCYCKLCAGDYRLEKSLLSRRNNSVSIAQYLINIYGKDNLAKYIDVEKNAEDGIDPYTITHGSRIKIWMKCINTDYHDSYLIVPSDIQRGRGCPYCAGRKVHPFDSLGKVLEDKGLLELWSDKNTKSPYEYMRSSDEQVWFKCSKEEHNDYFRSICNSIQYSFRCPECQYSKGEKVIERYLKTNDIFNIPQKGFNGLIGLKGGSLSYDFYLPEYNLLIEYQGEYHDGTVKFKAETTKEYNSRFLKQQEHDKRKKKYAQSNHIKLLEIWYWNFDSIEETLDKQLKHIEVKEII